MIMGATQRKISEDRNLLTQAVPDAAPGLRAADHEMRPVASPARLLQEQLHADIGAVAIPQRRNVRLVTFVLTALALWGGTAAIIGTVMMKAA
jgi:hypothetical protein